MIHNATARALIAAVIFFVALWVMNKVLLSWWVYGPILIPALVVALAVAIAVFIGLARPARRPSA